MHLFWRKASRLKSQVSQELNGRRGTHEMVHNIIRAHRSRHTNLGNDLSLHPPASSRLSVVVLEQPTQPHTTRDRSFGRR